MRREWTIVSVSRSFDTVYVRCRRPCQHQDGLWAEQVYHFEKLAEGLDPKKEKKFCFPPHVPFIGSPQGIYIQRWGPGPRSVFLT